MTNADEIRSGFALLRLTCDPRGHAVLEALETIALQQAEVVDKTIHLIDILEPENAQHEAIVTRIDRYSRKV